MWVVHYNGRAGGHAHAVFASEQEARTFVERHAEITTSDDMPANWRALADGFMLTTTVGQYIVTRSEAE